jgi:hypothetical protein
MIAVIDLSLAGYATAQAQARFRQVQPRSTIAEGLITVMGTTAVARSYEAAP